MLSREYTIGANNRGNTSLHDIVRTCTSFKEFYSRISPYTADELRAMAVKLNDDGENVLEILNKNLFANEDKYEIFCTLVRYSIPYGTKPLKKAINKFDVIARHNFENRIELLNNIFVGCEVVNEVKAAINVSTTHPSQNVKSLKAQQESDVEIKLSRRWVDFYHHKPANHDSEAVKLRWLDRYARHCRAYKIGNCYEYSYLAANLLAKKHPSLSSHVVMISNGDHFFVVIDQSYVGEAALFKSKTAVVVDAWMGDVYPVSEYKARLKDFRMHRVSDYFPLKTALGDKSFNCLYDLNRKYHKFKIDLTISPSLSRVLPPPTSIWRFSIFKPQDNKTSLKRKHYHVPSSDELASVIAEVENLVNLQDKKTPAP